MILCVPAGCMSDDLYGYPISTIMSLHHFGLKQMFDIYETHPKYLIFRSCAWRYLFNPLDAKIIARNKTVYECLAYNDDNVVSLPHILEWYRIKLLRYKEIVKKKIINIIKEI